jgi:hypothetical protein
MKNSKTAYHREIPAGVNFDDSGFTIAETLTAISIVSLLLTLLLAILSVAGINAARSKETLFFLRNFLEFDGKIREKAAGVIIPYWERTVTLNNVSPPEGRGAPDMVLEIPYYGGIREGILRLSADQENHLSLESSGGETQEYYSAPGDLRLRDIEVLHDGEGRPLALKFSFEHKNRRYYTLAPFAAFPLKRRFYG